MTVISIAKLVVTSGPLSGCEFFLDADETSIGRRTNNTIVVPDPAVSRTHGVIKPIGDGSWAYFDSGSENGTLVNGAKVTYQVLSEGDAIQIGNTTFVVQFAGSPSGPSALADPFPETPIEDLVREGEPSLAPEADFPAGPILDPYSRTEFSVSPAPVASHSVPVPVTPAPPAEPFLEEPPAEAAAIALRDLEPARNPFRVVDRAAPVTPEMGAAFRELTVISRLLLQTGDLESAAVMVAEGLVTIGRLTRCEILVHGPRPLSYGWRDRDRPLAGDPARQQAVERATRDTGLVAGEWRAPDAEPVQLVAAFSSHGAPALLYAERAGEGPIVDNHAYLLQAVAELFGLALQQVRREA